MLQIGDRVTTKKIGVPVTGNVFVMTDPMYYLHIVNPHALQNPMIWDLHYPDWRQKPIVAVLFDHPVREWSKQEYSSSSAAQLASINPNYIDTAYRMMPGVSVDYYPIDDIELLSEMKTHEFVERE